MKSNHQLWRKFILRNIDVTLLVRFSHIAKLVLSRMDRIMNMNVMLRELTTHQTSTKQKV